MTDNVPQLLNLVAVARALSISPHTVRKMVRDGRLRPVRICRRLLFSADEVTRLLAAAE
jgi:excisionase family DNA binding protein